MPPLGPMVPLHQAWIGSTTCRFCGKPEAEWGVLEVCPVGTPDDRRPPFATGGAIEGPVPNWAPPCTAPMLPPWILEALSAQARQAGAVLPGLGPHGAVVFLAEALSFIRGLPGDSIDLIATDPPYSSGGFTRSDRILAPERKYAETGSAFNDEAHTFAGDGRDQHSFLMWMTLWLIECHRVLRTGRIVAVFCDWRQVVPAIDAIQAGGFIHRGIGVWSKGPGGGRPRKGGFRNGAEFWVWGSKGPMEPPVPGEDPEGLYHAGRIVVPEGYGEVECVSAKGDRFHLTEKPVPVMEHVIAPCPPGGLILDPFAGSGSTFVAAVRTKRRAIGCDVVPHHVATAAERIAAEAAGVTLSASRGRVASDRQGSIFDAP